MHVRKITKYAKHPCLQGVQYQIHKGYVCSPDPTEINNEFQSTEAKVDLIFEDGCFVYASAEVQAIFILDSCSQVYFHREKIFFLEVLTMFQKSAAFTSDLKNCCKSNIIVSLPLLLHFISDINTVND